MSPTSNNYTNKALIQRIKEELGNDFKDADRMMMIMVLLHWIGVSTLTAYTYSTYLFGFLAGAFLSAISAASYYWLRGTVYSRSIFGIVLMGFSAIMIQQHLGRIEMHFHIFVAIAFLTIYKDYKPAVFAGIATSFHHFFANYLQSHYVVVFDIPISVFNYGCGIDIVMLHAFFVILEVAAITWFIIVDKKRFVSVITSQFHFEQLNETLEDTIEDRTRDYLSAKQDAEASNRAKSIFLANMSHEIRTPLNAILGFIGILQEQEQDKEKSKYINTIKKSGESLIEIINDILDFAKIESGKLSIDKTIVNPHDDFDNIGSLFYAKAEDMGLHFHLYIDPQLPKAILIDSLRIRQVLTNLLSNAIKFTETDGVVALEIRYNQTESTLYFSVKDSGIGIAKENQAKIFEAFAQEETSTSRKYGGTGLGLSISYKLVELMGGKLELKSELGIGSQFYFTLPVQISDMKGFGIIPNISEINVALFCPDKKIDNGSVLGEYLNSFGITKQFHPDDIHAISPNEYQLVIINSVMYTDQELQKILDAGHSVIMIKSSLNENYNNRLSGRIIIIDPPFTPSNVYDALMSLFTEEHRLHATVDVSLDETFSGNILVAEDNEANQYLMSVILKSLKLNYAFANDGVEAVRMYEHGNYDLILMDENMPNMNGTEATRLILEYEREKALLHTPIVALTANAIKGDRERFLAAGMDEYLSKPIDKEKLLAVFSHYLSGKPISTIPSEQQEEEQTDESKSTVVYDTIDTLAHAMGYDVEDVQIMVNMFINKIDTHLAALDEASVSKNYDTLFRTAHTIKGSSGNLKFETIYALSGEIEKAARDQKEIDYQALIDQLKKQINIVRKLGNQ